MKKNKNYLFSISYLFFLFLVLGLTISCNSKKLENQSKVNQLPYYQEATFTPHWFAPNSDKLKQFHKIAPFQLIDQNGKKITEKTFEYCYSLIL